MWPRGRVPLALAFLDFARREVGVEHFLQLCGDREADMAEHRRAATARASACGPNGRHRSA